MNTEKKKVNPVLASFIFNAAMIVPAVGAPIWFGDSTYTSDVLAGAMLLALAATLFSALLELGDDYAGWTKVLLGALGTFFLAVLIMIPLAFLVRLLGT